MLQWLGFKYSYMYVCISAAAKDDSAILVPHIYVLAKYLMNSWTDLNETL